jgi:hypothetical protein
VVTVVCVATAWVCYSLNWIRARNGLLDHQNVYVVSEPQTSDSILPSAPWGLWLLGERGYQTIAVRHRAGDEMILTAAKALFPEAVVITSEPNDQNP